VYFTDQQETECSVRQAAALVGRTRALRLRRLLRPAPLIIRAGKPAGGAAGRANAQVNFLETAESRRSVNDILQIHPSISPPSHLHSSTFPIPSYSPPVRRRSDLMPSQLLESSIPGTPRSSSHLSLRFEQGGR
jgi:hypothetical protein